MALILLIFLILKLEHHNSLLNTVLLVFCSVSYACVMLMDWFPMTTISKMVPASVQSLTQGVQQAFYRTGSGLALLTGGLIYQWLRVVKPAIFVIIAVLYTALLAKRKVYMNP